MTHPYDVCINHWNEIQHHEPKYHYLSSSTSPMKIRRWLVGPVHNRRKLRFSFPKAANCFVSAWFRATPLHFTQKAVTTALMRHLTHRQQQSGCEVVMTYAASHYLACRGRLLYSRGMMFLQSWFSPQLSRFLARNKCFDASPILKVYAGLIFAFMIPLTYAEPEFDTECCINRRVRNTWPFQLDRSIEVIVRSLSCLDSRSFTVFNT